MAIDRCICHKISFEEIRKISETQNFNTIEQLQEKRICSTNCRLCVPYIKVLLKTGKTSFSIK